MKKTIPINFLSKNGNLRLLQKNYDHEPSATLVFVGDIVPLGKIGKKLERDPTAVLDHKIIDLVSQADLGICNLEAPLCHEHLAPIIKAGPNLRASPSISASIKEIGFNIACLGNNHCMDYGWKGLRETLEACQQNGIETIGAEESEDKALQPIIKSINGIKFGILNAGEVEEAKATFQKPGAASIFSEQFYGQLKSLRKTTDVVVTIIHAGCEYVELPAPYVRERYHKIADLGSDIIVAHHPHVGQGIEYYNGTLIAYSLGNFLFDASLIKKRRITVPEQLNGLILRVTFHGPRLATAELIPAYQDLKKHQINLHVGNSRNQILGRLQRLSDALIDDKRYSLFWEKHCQYWYRHIASQNLIGSLISTEDSLFMMARKMVFGGILAFLRRKDKKKSAARVLNYLETPAHLERLKLALKNLTDSAGNKI